MTSSAAPTPETKTHDAKTVDPKRRALGKGLESLLPSRPTAAPPASPENAAGAAAAPVEGKPREISVNQIERNPYQTRKSVNEEQLAELARSISATGVVQPIIVRPLPDGRFQLIAGERRWLASRKAGKLTVPAILRNVSDEQALEMTIVENLQRADLNAMEQARAFERLSREFNLTQEQVAQRTGKDRVSVSNYIRLLRLPKEVQLIVEEGLFTYGHARSLLALESQGSDSSDDILRAAHKILSQHMSVRQTEIYVQGLMNPERAAPPASKAKAKEQDPNVREAQDRLQRSLGLRVRIEDTKGKGRVIIEYSGLEDFDALLDALAGDK